MFSPSVMGGGKGTNKVSRFPLEGEEHLLFRIAIGSDAQSVGLDLRRNRPTAPTAEQRWMEAGNERITLGLLPSILR